jgi:hypothetical protein
MDLLSASALAETTPAVGEEKLGLQLTKTEIEILAPVEIFGGDHFAVNAMVENIPLGGRQANYFSGSEFKELEVIETPDLQGVQIRLGEQEFNLSLQEGSLLETLGVRNLVSYALSSGIEQFMQVRLEHLRGDALPVEERLGAAKIELPTDFAVAVRPSDAGRFVQELEKTSVGLEELETPMWFEAKRIDYLIGEQYIEGRICNLPIVGGISNFIFKDRLEMEIAGTDWARLGDEVFIVLSIAAIPFIPVSGPIAFVVWVGANAGFGALNRGVCSFLSHQDEQLAWKEAGIGALIGSVGGIAGLGALTKLGPAVGNRILDDVATGTAIGASTSVTEATIRVIDKGEDFATAAKEIAVAALIGGAGGGAIGGVLHPISKFVSRVAPEVRFAKGPSEIQRAEGFRNRSKEVEPMIPQGRTFHMGDVRMFTREIADDLDGFAAHLKTTDEGFSRRIENFREKMADALLSNDPTRIAVLERQMRQGLSGELAEGYGKFVFQPFFETVKTQVRRPVEGGATIIDLVFEKARHPIAIKGHRLVDKGEDLAVEIKAGSENYFRSEIQSGHLLKQVGGHAEFGKSLIVTTRDVSDALMAGGRAREVLKDAGATPYRLLPLKGELDAAIKRLVYES